MTQLVADITNVAVVGVGSFGSALLAHMDHQVHRGAPLSVASVVWDGTSASDSVAIREADCLVLAVESAVARDALQAIARDRLAPALILGTTKALEPGTGHRLSAVALEVLGEKLGAYAVLAGGVTAQDLARGGRLLATVASASSDAAHRVCDLLGCEQFGCDQVDFEISEDVVGVEYASAFGSVLSLAVGIAKGAGLGAGAQARLVTTLSREIESLAMSLGAAPETFSRGSHAWGSEVYLSGAATTPSREFGALLGRRFSVDEALAVSSQRNSNVEGYHAACGMGRLTELQSYPTLCGVFELVVGARTLEEAAGCLFGSAE